MSEEALGFQRIADTLMIGEYLAIVIGQSVNVGSLWRHGFGDCGADRCCCFVFCFDDHAEPTLTLSKRDQDCSALFADDRIRFPLSNAASGFNTIWTLSDAHPPYVFVRGALLNPGAFGVSSDTVGECAKCHPGACRRRCAGKSNPG